MIQLPIIIIEIKNQIKSQFLQFWHKHVNRKPCCQQVNKAQS